MAISIGDKFPNSTFKIMTDEGPGDVTSDEIFSGKRVVLFALPGAFTPTCHLNHLPGYLENLEQIKSKGIDAVYVLSVNDVWVMDAWATANKAKGKIGFLCDGSAIVTKAIGMEVDLDPAGMGIRSKRYSMILDDGVVQVLNIEDKPGQATVSGASTIMQQL
ncbi:MAG: peroxiredoxin [Rhizobiaceae bacterium]|nr:peroxiredoxin [Rhizobiaceae bacterium]